MKKFLYLAALVLALVMPVRAAQLTVNDGDQKSYHTPMYVFYFDTYSRTQHIIPATDLTAMQGKWISQVTYYVQYTNETFPQTTAENVDFYLKEVENTTISAYVDKADAQIVYHGQLTFYEHSELGKVVDIVFDTPYKYNGGNLLVGCENLEHSDIYYITEFAGVVTTGTMVYGSHTEDPSLISCTVDNFLPKTTFTYSAKYPAPEELVATAKVSAANISWNGIGDAYDLRYAKASEVGGRYEFEDGLSPWTTIDADGDGYDWVWARDEEKSVGGTDQLALSASWWNSQVLYPDNYLVSPKVTFGGSISFYAASMSDTYYQEHFGVAVSTTGNTDPADFTLLNEWTLDVGETFKQYTVDLSAYEGQEGYVAIRHFDCSDQLYLFIDNVVINVPDKWTEVNDITTTSFKLTELEPNTEYVVQVRSKKGENLSEWVQISLTTLESNPVPTELKADNLTTTSADLSWKGVGDAYDVRYVDKDETMNFTFDVGLGAWTSLDADGDGFGWRWGEDAGKSVDGNGKAAISSSYDNGVTLHPDNYLISPKVKLGGSISFEAAAKNNDYEEHFGVAVSTTGTNPEDFTLVDEWTMDEGQVFKPFSVDLSAYEGEGYIAIRHFNCSDNYSLLIDNITIEQPEGVTPAWTEENDYVGTSLTLSDLAPQTAYLVQVRSKMEGENDSEWAELSFSTLNPNPTPKDVYYANVTYTSADINWTGSGDSYEVRYITDEELSKAYKQKPVWTVVPAAASPFTLTELAKNTRYVVNVRSIKDGEAGAWSETNAFNTLNPNPSPSYFTISDVQTNGASLSWEGIAGQVFEIGYVLFEAYNFAAIYDMDIPWKIVNAGSALTYDLTGLTEGLQYVVAVRAKMAGEEDSDWTSRLTFTTLQNLPISDLLLDDDFESGNDWTFINGDQTNKWVYGDKATDNATNALYISNDDGVTHAYSNGATAVYATRNITFEQDGKYVFQFQYIGKGEVNSRNLQDYLRVLLAPETAELTAGARYTAYSYVPSGCYALDGGQGLANESAWKQRSTELSLKAGTYKIVLMWVNDESRINNPPAGIDNFKVGTALLASPQNLKEKNITANSANLSWTPVTEETEWEVAYKKALEADYTTQLVTEPTVDLSTLKGHTVYHWRVRAVNGVEHSQWSYYRAFITVNPNPAPEVSITGGTEESISIAWTANGDKFDLRYATKAEYDAAEGAPAWTELNNFGATKYTFSGLTVNTAYVIQVRSRMAGEDDSDWSQILAKTLDLTAFVTLPYEDDFEAENTWTLINGDQTNKWVYGEHATDNATHALYISNDGGETHAYDEGKSSSTFAVKPVQVTEKGVYHFQYDYYCVGESDDYDFLRVMLAPAPVVLAAGELPSGLYYNNVPEGWFALDGGNGFTGISEWETMETELPLTPGYYQIVLWWYNDYSSTDGAPAAFDNLSITKVECPKPIDLTVSDLTKNSAKVSWTALGSETEWELAYEAAGDEDWTKVSVHTTSYELTGLVMDTKYYVKVRAICGEEEAWTESINFTTPNPNPDPKNLQASAVTTNSTTISWTGITGQTFDLWYISKAVFDATPEGDDPAWTQKNDFIDVSVDLTGLEAGMTYLVQVRAKVAGEPDTEWKQIGFTTLEDISISSVLLEDDFESGNLWTLINGEQTNKWAYGDKAADNLAHALYISNDEGVTHAYNTSATTTVYATRDLTISADGVYAFQYDYLSDGETNCDYLRVFLAPEETTLTAGDMTGLSRSGTPEGWYSLDGGSYIARVTEWKTKLEMVQLTAGDYKIVLMWHNDFAAGENPPAAFDNLKVGTPSCSTPTGLEVTDLTKNSAKLTWTPAGEETKWEVAYRKNSESIYTFKTVDAAEYQLTGLQKMTTYYWKVRAVCGASDHGAWTKDAEFYTPDPNPLPILALTTATEHEATLTWKALASQTFDLRLTTKAAIEAAGEGEPEWLVTRELLAATTFEFTDLEEATIYYVQVRAHAEDEPDTQWTGLYFQTLNMATVASLPFEDDFEAGNEWTLINGDQLNKWVYGDKAKDNATHALYISNDDKGTHQYYAFESVSMASRTFEVTEEAFYGLQLDAICPLTSDYFGVMIVPASEVCIAGQWPYNYIYKATYSHLFSWQTLSAEIELKPGFYQLVLVWNNGLTGFGTPAAVDNIRLFKNNCRRPKDLTLYDGTVNSFKVKWTPVGSETAWEVAYKTASDEDWTSVPADATPFELTGLRKDTEYTVKVRAVCGEEESSFWTEERSYQTVNPNPVPSGLNASTSETKATLYWTGITGQTFDLWYISQSDLEATAEGDEPAWTKHNDLATGTFDITGLTKATKYYVQVRGKVAGEDDSDWSRIAFFTDNPNPAPEFSLITPDVTSAKVYWSGYGDKYDLRYLKVSDLPAPINDFATGLGEGWTTIDADGDGYDWFWAGESGPQLNGDSLLVASQSYDNITNKSLRPDNYLVSPKVTLGGTLLFKAASKSNDYYEEHFAVAVATTDNPKPSDFTTVEEWTLYYYGTFYWYSVDLSAFSGEGHIAIRHFDCEDEYELLIDNIYLLQPAFDWNLVSDIDADSYELTGLDSNTDYIVQVRSKMSGEPDSEWSFGVRYATLNPNPAPSSISVSDITVNSANVSWSAVGDVCDLRYIDEEAFLKTPEGEEPEWIVKSDLSVFKLDLTELTEATTYIVQVRSRKTGEPDSEWSQIRFQTVMNSWENWTYYDDGICGTNFGDGTVTDFTWGIRIPAPIEEVNMISAVAVYENSYNNNPITVTLASGGATPDDAEMLHTETFEPLSNGYHVVPVKVNFEPTKDLWIIFSAEDEHPAAFSKTSGLPDGRWFCTSIRPWKLMDDYGDYTNCSWMIRALLEQEPITGVDQTAGGEIQKVTKILRNGQIYILRDGKVYTIMGHLVE